MVKKENKSVKRFCFVCFFVCVCFIFIFSVVHDFLGLFIRGYLVGGRSGCGFRSRGF